MLYTHLFSLAVVAVLVVVLVAVAVLVIVLVLVLILILVLIVHDFLPPKFLRVYRHYRLPQSSGFILCPEDQACKQAGNNGSGNAARCGFQATG